MVNIDKNILKYIKLDNSCVHGIKLLIVISSKSEKISFKNC